MRGALALMSSALLGGLMLSSVAEAAPEKLSFPSEDGLTITADLYSAHPATAPMIVLFHQAGWSRGEYLEIAPKLNKMGFNCLAIDQRSGGGVNNVKNETAARAKKAGKPTQYIHALQDMRAALKFAKAKHAKGKLIAWGSSYSAALTLKLAGDHPELVDAALSFAPGEYFKKQGKPGDWIQRSARKIQGPVFITSAKNEAPYWTPIFKVVPSKAKVSYLPKTKGNHGSRALWAKFSDHAGYWDAVRAFLKANKLI